MKTVVIIGNGFDLDLGLKTSYRDFVTSQECKMLQQGGRNYLLSMIANKFHLLNWIDLEEELKQFAIRHSPIALPRHRDFKAEFQDITKCLHKYLTRIQESIKETGLREISCAAQLLKLMCEYPSEFEIYNFNYTDLNVFAETLGYKGCLDCSNVHGKLEGGSIILGFEDDVHELRDFHYMIKTFNSNYSTSHVRESLSKAREVIIFGHSLGKTDYPYFSEFFTTKSSGSSETDVPTRISFVTSNEDSKLSIMKQLKVMNNDRTNILLDRNDVTFLTTNNWSTIPLFHHILQRLKVEANAKALLQKWQNENACMSLAENSSN
jgi:hypothetical protein